MAKNLTRKSVSNLTKSAQLNSFKDLQSLKTAMAKSKLPTPKVVNAAPQNQHHKDYMAAQQLLTELKTRYPKSFDLKAPLPLAIGIAQEINKQLPEIKPAIIRMALGWWTKQKVYLETVINGSQRFNLTGEAVAPILDSEKEYSQNTLNRKYAK